MIPEFVDFCQKLFPSIDPYTAEAAKRAVKRYQSLSGTPLLCRLEDTIDYLQGDIYTELPFYFVDQNGNLRTFKAKAQLLSNTCDAVRDDQLLFAAMRPLAKYPAGMQSAIKGNQRYSTFYIDSPATNLDYVDFELINAFSRTAFIKLCNNGSVKRIASLTSVGYYMFICKLTVFLMRPEDPQTNSERS